MSFGPLSPLERYRVQALAAEARGDWRSVERSWSLAARLTGAAEDRTSRLSSGVIYRHLAHSRRKRQPYVRYPVRG